MYIGQTCNYKRRVQQHKWELRNRKHTNKFLQKDYDIYGDEKFEFLILADNIGESERLEEETFYMNMFGGTNSDNIYNVKGNFNDDNHTYALSKVEHCNGKFDLFKNHHHTEDSKKKIGKSLKSAYARGERKLAGAVLGNNFGENNAFYGRHHTDAVKDKLSKLRTKYDEEFIAELRCLKSNGWTIVNIAEKYNMNKNVVGSLINYGTSSRKAIASIKNSFK